ncbi:hypothetical protein L483_14595 [Pseudomonas putida H8234]|nr:hypothetical protein L483_14595 [Pseudomonas putida H8234]
MTRRHATASRDFKQISDQRPFCVRQTTGVALFRQLAPVGLGVTIRLLSLRWLETTFGSFLYTNDPGQPQRFGKGIGMSGNTRFSMECLRQFGLAGIGLRMSEPGQQRVMLRSDYGRASGFRHGSMLRRQGTSSLLYFVYTLLEQC